MLTLYPFIEPYKIHELAVDSPHRIYVEEVGNPKGIPILFVHGGPGAGCKADHRRYFDPEKYRIILFDQRGSGQSTPHAYLEDNTTQDLVNDMELIRKYLGIEQWVLFGGSWGSTLSLVYAQTYPQHVFSLILRGIFLLRKEEIEWFYQKGASYIFPDYWEHFISIIPENERQNILTAYYKRLTEKDEIARMAAAKAWSLWEGQCATLHPNKQITDTFKDPHLALSLARIECHFFINNGFLKENQIIENMHKLQTIPGIIIHGRYDMVCPFESAWLLHKAWPLSELKIIRDAGHAASEAGITDALIHATNEMAIHLR